MPFTNPRSIFRLRAPPHPALCARALRGVCVWGGSGGQWTAVSQRSLGPRVHPAAPPPHPPLCPIWSGCGYGVHNTGATVVGGVGRGPIQRTFAR